MNADKRIPSLDGIRAIAILLVVYHLDSSVRNRGRCAYSSAKCGALLGKSAIFLCVALGIDILILRHDSAVGKIANASPQMWLGRISYSLYLWQQIFLLDKRGSYAWFPANLSLAFLCAALPYHCVEQPAIRLGRWVIQRREQAQVSAIASPIAEPEV
jgi:peptidoglycan/LPS O-acetylase OafA/YrhL